MKKFKRIFYIICFLFFLVVIFIVLFQKAILFDTESALYMGRIGLAIFLIKFGGVGLGLFVATIVIENLHISSLKSTISILEQEKIELKAKLYDKRESEEATVEIEEEIEKKDTE